MERKSMIAGSGGGKVTVEGLAAEKILVGNTVLIKQGSKMIADIIGCGSSDYAAWFSPGARGNPQTSMTATSLLKANSNIGTLSGGTFTISQTGKYRIFVMGYGSGDWTHINFIVNGVNTQTGNTFTVKELNLEKGATIVLSGETGKNNTTVGVAGMVVIYRIE